MIHWFISLKSRNRSIEQMLMLTDSFIGQIDILKEKQILKVNQSDQYVLLFNKIHQRNIFNWRCRLFLFYVKLCSFTHEHFCSV